MWEWRILLSSHLADFSNIFLSHNNNDDNVAAVDEGFEIVSSIIIIIFPATLQRAKTNLTSVHGTPSTSSYVWCIQAPFKLHSLNLNPLTLVYRSLIHLPRVKPLRKAPRPDLFTHLMCVDWIYMCENSELLQGNPRVLLRWNEKSFCLISMCL